jgi:hypothetical protein
LIAQLQHEQHVIGGSRADVINRIHAAALRRVPSPSDGVGPAEQRPRVCRRNGSP